ncbi:uncharacterized protein LOC132549930 [Ylistrum balloti]|uniref:uncharacterized protein LOC132549930 n=1 Tax=Ylistrum balloti TaxID=509963 RepID=UPI002905C6BE|nr:uncharacterized protein LOC132549930 [Ylistrum balloti]
MKMRTSRLRWRRFFFLSIGLFLLSVFMFYQSLSIENVTCLDRFVSPRISNLHDQLITIVDDKKTNMVFRQSADSKLISSFISDMEGNLIPNSIHIVWCHNRSLHFENYLSILSAWKIMQPDIIEFHTKYDIHGGQDKYNYWFEDLKKTIPGFVVKVMPNYNNDPACGVWYGIDVLLDRGGMYISDTMFLMQSLRHLRRKDSAIGVTDGDWKVSYAMSTDHNRPALVTLKQLLTLKNTEDSDLTLPNNYSQCEQMGNDFEMLFENTTCVELPALHPKDIMHSNTSFAYNVRLILYGDSALVAPKTRLPGVIPKIIHLVWFNRKTMDFMMYLSLRSALTFLKPDKVYIHGDKLLEGEYMEKFKRDPRIIMVNREVPRYVFGKDVLYTQHKSDIIRADVLLKYGGIYMDWDVLWLRPIDDLIQTGYDAIVNFDHMPWPDFPDAFNLGVLMAKPGSEFIKNWQAALVDYRSWDFFYNAILLPYKIYERYPHSVHIEKHLQVMCYQLKCHPIFRPGYKNYNREQDFNWKMDTYSVHFTFPDPPALTNASTLRKGKGMFADIGRYILEQPYEYD